MRLAIVLAALVAAAVRRLLGASRPQRVLRHRRRLDRRAGPPGNGERKGPVGALPAQVAGSGADQQHLRLGREGSLHRRSRGARDPAGPVRVGLAGVGEWSAPAQPPTANATVKQEWQNFLRDAVARYGPNGTYWANEYTEQFPGATPLPVTSWQVWNEPNLKKYFSPGATVQASAQKYATLLQLSHDAIKAVDPSAMIVLAGMPGQGDSTAWVLPQRHLRRARGQGLLRRCGDASLFVHRESG